MNRARWISGAVASLALMGTLEAQAHFKLVKPASWLNEDQLGGPQKGSPCGPGNAKLFIGDDVQPVPLSSAVTTFRAGETVTVQWDETIYHPGYFRISLAKVRPADASARDFPDPPLTDLQNCHYDRSAVKTVPHDNVLADGLFMAEAENGENRSLMQAVKLPDEPCEHCTLQIVQVMEGHPAASCFYFHCAEIKIEAAGGGTADGGTADAGGTKPEAGGSDGGCSVAAPSARVGAHWWLALGVAALTRLRRRRVRAA
jgi:hypothetical protein